VQYNVSVKVVGVVLNDERVRILLGCVTDRDSGNQ
jgi:hypothetical protein